MSCPWCESSEHTGGRNGYELRHCKNCDTFFNYFCPTCKSIHRSLGYNRELDQYGCDRCKIIVSREEYQKLSKEEYKSMKLSVLKEFQVPSCPWCGSSQHTGGRNGYELRHCKNCDVLFNFRCPSCKSRYRSLGYNKKYDQYGCDRCGLILTGEEYLRMEQPVSIHDPHEEVEFYPPKEMLCPFCQAELPEDADDCPDCGIPKLTCKVCNLTIVYGDDFVKCPHCNVFAHRVELIEWIKTKGICPNCQEKLSESDIPS